MLTHYTIGKANRNNNLSSSVSYSSGSTSEVLSESVKDWGDCAFKGATQPLRSLVVRIRHHQQPTSKDNNHVGMGGGGRNTC